MSRLVPIALLAAVIALPTPAAADPLPINWWFEPDHVGLWYDGTFTNNHPTGLTLDRSDEVANALSWTAPSFSDGRTLTGYWVYRFPSDASTPVHQVWVDGASTTTWTDTNANFSKGYAYTVTAEFEDAAGSPTESLPVELVIAHPVADGGPGYPYCQTLQINLAVFPYVFANANCLWPPPV